MYLRQRGIIHLLPLLLLGAVLVGGAFLVFSGKFQLSSLFSKKANVKPQTTFENPFKQETQYVNPFDQSKNPFTVGR